MNQKNLESSRYAVSEEEIFAMEDRVTRMAKRVAIKLRRYNEEDEFAQEMWIKVMRAAERYDERMGVKFETYAKGTIRYTANDIMRAHFRRRQIAPMVFLEDPVGEDMTRMDFISSDGLSPEQIVVNEQMEDFILQLLEDLPDLKRYFEGEAQAEMAKEQNITRAGVNARIKKQRQRLMVELSHLGIDRMDLVGFEV